MIVGEKGGGGKRIEGTPKKGGKEKKLTLRLRQFCIVLRSREEGGAKEGNEEGSRRGKRRVSDHIYPFVNWLA